MNTNIERNSAAFYPVMQYMPQQNQVQWNQTQQQQQKIEQKPLNFKSKILTLSERIAQVDKETGFLVYKSSLTFFWLMGGLSLVYLAVTFVLVFTFGDRFLWFLILPFITSASMLFTKYKVVYFNDYKKAIFVYCRTWRRKKEKVIPYSEIEDVNAVMKNPSSGYCSMVVTTTSGEKVEICGERHPNAMKCEVAALRAHLSRVTAVHV